MDIDGWKYYNHAAVPNMAPHMEPDLTPIKNGRIWKMEGKPLLATWTSDWDCGHETTWWYCIRDGVFDIKQLSSSSRKHIRQALKHNTVQRRKISEDVIPEMYKVYKEATKSYSNADNIVDSAQYYAMMRGQKKEVELFVAYDIDQNLVAYMTVLPYDDWVEILTAKFGTTAMKIQSSNALYYYILDYYLNQRKMQYVSSGERNINHETGTQEYKERVFGYRKAYCKLHVKYRPIIGLAVNLLYPFRKILKKYEKTTMWHQVNAVLMMEELVRMGN